jgi:hypothetical protein
MPHSFDFTKQWARSGKDRVHRSEVGSGSARSSAEPQSEMLAVVGPTGCSPVALTRRQLSACAAEGDQRTPLFCRDKVWWWVGATRQRRVAGFTRSPWGWGRSPHCKVAAVVYCTRRCGLLPTAVVCRRQTWTKIVKHVANSFTRASEGPYAWLDARTKNQGRMLSNKKKEYWICN